MVLPIWKLWRRARDDLAENKIVCYVCDVEVEHFVTIDLAEWEPLRGLFGKRFVRGNDYAVMNLCFLCFDKLPENLDERIVNFIRGLISDYELVIKRSE